MWVNYLFGVAQSVVDQLEVPGHFKHGTEPQILDEYLAFPHVQLG